MLVHGEFIVIYVNKKRDTIPIRRFTPFTGTLCSSPTAAGAVRPASSSSRLPTQSWHTERTDAARTTSAPNVTRFSRAKMNKVSMFPSVTRKYWPN